MKDDAERAREAICEDVWLSIPAYLHKSIINRMLAFAQQPEGWVLVPKQPTDAMYEAAASSWDGALSTYWALAMWSAMLNVAPIPGEE